MGGGLAAGLATAGIIGLEAATGGVGLLIVGGVAIFAGGSGGLLAWGESGACEDPDDTSDESPDEGNADPGDDGQGDDDGEEDPYCNFVPIIIPSAAGAYLVGSKNLQEARDRAIVFSVALAGATLAHVALKAWFKRSEILRHG